MLGFMLDTLASPNDTTDFSAHSGSLIPRMTWQQKLGATMKTLKLTQQISTSVFLSTALVFSPVLIDQLPGIDFGTEAQAKPGNGGGNGGGKGGGRSGGKSSGKNSSKSADRGHNGNRYGHDKTAKADKLKGSLNAAHASAQGKAHAAPHSRVGVINTYEKAITAGDVTDEQASQISDLLSELDNPELTNQELHALQAELAAVVNDLESGEPTNEADIDTLAAAALHSLQTASNKELDSEGKMVDAVNSLLNIDESNVVAERVKTLNNPEPTSSETTDPEAGVDEETPTET